jgi:hypothetical protein
MLKTKNLHTLYRDLFQVIDSPNESTAVLCRIAVLCRSQIGISLKGNPRAKKRTHVTEPVMDWAKFCLLCGGRPVPDIQHCVGVQISFPIA